MKSKLFAAALAAVALAGCETATPYQPLTPGGVQTSGGYADQKIEANRWRVRFAGNDLTSRETVERYLLFRAAQLTIDQGFDWFTTVERGTDTKTSYLGDPYGPWGGYWAPMWGFYNPRFGWGYGYWGGPGYGWGRWRGRGPAPVGFDEITQYTASAEIIMGKGQKPADDRRAFDARAVVQNLQSTIIYPKTAK